MRKEPKSYGKGVMLFILIVTTAVVGYFGYLRIQTVSAESSTVADTQHN